MREMVQVRITAPGKHFIPEGYVRTGQVLWVSRERADTLINKQRIAEPAAAGPTEAKPAAPTENKARAGGDPASLSIDSAKSSADGMLESSSASREAHHSAMVNSGTLSKPKRGRPKKSES